jgi:hypothetical protein
MDDTTNQPQVIKILVSPAPNEAKSGLTTNVDVAATISSVLWPVVILTVLLVYRHKLAILIGRILSRVKKVEFAGISLEWAEVKELSTGWLVPEGGLDLRSSQQGLEVFESSGANILAQLEQPLDGDYVVIDLGDGGEWLTSRLFILAVLFEGLRGVKALVFVDTKDGIAKHYVGWAEPKMLTRALAKRYPKFEAAYSAARAIIDKPHLVYLPQSNVPITQTGLLDSQAGSDLFKQFLFRLKPRSQPVIPLNEAADWTPMPSNPGFSEYAGKPNEPSDVREWVELNGIRFYEYAQWLNRTILGELLGENLHTAALNEARINGKPESVKIRAVLFLKGDLVALVKENERFDQLIDRRALMEEVLAANLAEE